VDNNANGKIGIIVVNCSLKMSPIISLGLSLDG